MVETKIVVKQIELAASEVEKMIKEAFPDAETIREGVTEIFGAALKEILSHAELKHD
jgi:hypothetical protein